ncbi:MAG TPA: outer membrane protein assembly factor BamD, partial [Gammaproteobacteria bacterium]|nr:outer membrane protein assembly factor BamD [Gammaproteobacteria bacterium]
MPLAALVLLSVIASGCSSIPFFGKDDEDADIEAIETTEERVYSQAQRALRSSNFSVAIEQLELLEARFPFGRFAEQAQLELIYAHYLTQDMESARANADRFIRLHPTHPNVDYAFYLKGLSAYKFEDGLLDRLFSAEPASRDMAPLRESYSELAVLLNEFPNSQYASDARQRMLQLRELLARSEIFAADYYLRRGAFIAAANRGIYVIDNYPDTAARADALSVMVEAYYKLGRTDEANRSLRVLALN